MAQYPRKQESRERREGRGDREPNARSFPEDEDEFESTRGYGGRSERDYGGWREQQGFNRPSGRDWRDDERTNWEDYGRGGFRGESQGNRGYRSQDMMEGPPSSGNWDEQYGRFGGYGERSERSGWGSPYGRSFRQGQGWQGGQGSQGWQGQQGGGQRWGQGQGYGQGSPGGGFDQGYSQTGEYSQGRGYGQGGTYGQTGKYGQIGAQMSGGRFGEGYGQGAFGGFRGKGPKGYERSDERLKEMVCERLTEDDQIDASDIMVDVRNGEVTLTGTVDDRMMKFQVEDMIERCGGVKEIHNNLRVARENRERQPWQTGDTGQTGKKEPMTTKAGGRSGNSE